MFLIVVHHNNVVGHHLATKVFTGKLPAIRGVWVIIDLGEPAIKSQQNVTVAGPIGVHLTMHLLQLLIVLLYLQGLASYLQQQLLHLPLP
jgi:hypothetical protein